jgi:MFS family permease
MSEERLTSDQRWNYWAYTIEGTFFIASSAFWEPGTVLPSYLSGLTTSPVLLGLGPAIKNAGWLMPQLLVAGMIEGRPRSKGVVVLAAAIGRLAFILLPILMLVPGIAPAVRIALFLGLYTVFSFAEGVTGVPWTEMMGRAIPAHRRGRLLGNMQSIAGLTSLLAGIAVRYLLGNAAFAYPVNYAILFAIGSVLLLGSGMMMVAVREPAGKVTRPRIRLVDNLRSIPARIRGNPVFGRLLATRLLAASPSLVLPFFVLYGQQELGLAPVWVGNSVTAQMLGVVLFGQVWARMSVRHGFQPLVRASCVAGALIPTWTLLAAAANTWPLTRALAPFLFLMTYLTIGAYFSSIWVGFTNYLLEIVPEPERPIYIGILSTAAGPMAFLAAPGGVLLALIGFLPTFALAVVGSLAAIRVASRLPSERRLANAVGQTGPG